MQYRNLGRWGLKVSEISVGSWMTNLNGNNAAEVAKDTIKLAYQNGVNFFDCADAYSGGEAERFLGQVLKQFPRSSYVVSSKVFFGVGPGANDWGLSRKHIFEQIDKSLKNMQEDYLDMYFCHRFDPTTPMEETLQALSDLVVQGKILYYGVSEEWGAARINKALGIIKEYGLRPMNVIQPQYNMVDRYIEDEIMSICEENGIGIVPFSPLSQGLLTGKYKKDQPLPEGSRATHQADKQINNLLTNENLEKVEKLSAIAADLGTNMSVLALAWILRKQIVSSVITGATKPEQLMNNIAASGFKIPEDAMNEIEKILDYHPFVRRVG
jgi:aryl-alcohol dehydrogenase-like predicted oxidoreductase